LRDNWDMEYLGLVSVGTPMQTFKGLIWKKISKIAFF
jgi:hypothetical protein